MVESPSYTEDTEDTEVVTHLRFMALWQFSIWKLQQSSINHECDIHCVMSVYSDPDASECQKFQS